MTESTVPTVPPEQKSMDEIVSLCKRRGFVYPASEIYGGLNGFWDYGPLGVALKNSIRDAWWRAMVLTPPIGPDGEPVSIVGLDSSIIQNPQTWVASGHVGGFNDPMVDCGESKRRYRADHLMVLVPADLDPSVAPAPGSKPLFAYLEGEKDDAAKKAKKAGLDVDTAIEMPFTTLVARRDRIVGPDAKAAGTLTEPRQFNLMFETYVGAIHSEDAKAYLRPETAQGIFLNFKNVLDTTRVRLPFGIAQIGKSFRNEVTPRNFIFRSREFEQMEMEWFCHPDESMQWYQFWRNERLRWWKSLGIADANLILRDHDPDELAHYSKACVDVEYKYPFSAPKYGELEGIAHRGCFDITAHQTHSRSRLEYFDQDAQRLAKEAGLPADEVQQRSFFVPHVIEPASGLTRAVLVLLCEAFTPDPNRPSKLFMKFDPRFAPVKAGIFPLVNKDGMPETSTRLFMKIRERHVVEHDVKQAIGKRYARMDEIGTPYCFTVDGQTAEDQTVTVRVRDTQAQERIHIDQVERYLAERIG